MRHRALALALVALGCQSTPSYPQRAATDFSADDPALAAVLVDAAADWCEAGLEVACYVTVNQDEGAVPVRLRARDALIAVCDLTADGTRPNGCVEYERGRFLGVAFADDLSAWRLGTVVRHELIHVIVPAAEHLDPRSGKIGIFTTNANSDTPTADDLAEMARHTEVTAPGE